MHRLAIIAVLALAACSDGDSAASDPASVRSEASLNAELEAEGGTARIIVTIPNPLYVDPDSAPDSTRVP